MEKTQTRERSLAFRPNDWDGRVTRAEIDLDALKHNISAFRQRVGDNVAIMAVVKANAYGHGSVPIAQTAINCGAKYLAVAVVDEGVVLRKHNVTAPILVLGYTPPSEMRTVAQYDLTATITREDQAAALASAASSLGATAKIHLKVDTGMNRLGCNSLELVDLATKISHMQSIDVEGLFTHFARADEADKLWTRQQFERYCYAREDLRKAGFEFRLYHCANSAATIDMPGTHLDMVRVGVSLYGLYPSSEVSHDMNLRPVMTLRSRIGRVHDLSSGDGVSYGYTFVAKEATKVALIPIGYGDGYRRALSNAAPILINGFRAKVVGRVCMDQTVVDVTHIDDVQVGDEAVLLGSQGADHISADELADLCGTINYEICTALSARVPKLYISEGRLLGYSDLKTDFSLGK